MQALQHVYDMDRKWYLSVNNDFATNGNIGNLEFGGTRWSMQGEWKIGYKDTRGYEAEGRLGRYIGEKQWLYPYIGADWTCRKGRPENATCSDRPPKRTGKWTAPWEPGTRCPCS